MSRYDLEPALDLEKRIEAAAGEDLRARWQFGRWMLSHVPDRRRKLPDGFLASLVDATGSSAAELKNRRQFAENFDEDALANAVSQRVSWHEITNFALGARGAASALDEREELSDDPPEGAEAETFWDAPEDLFAELDAEFGFDLDVRTLEEPLRRPWRGTCWAPAPVGGELEPWTAKARRAAEDDRATTVVCPLPARVDAEWWWEHCLSAEIRFLRGRLDLGGRPATSPCAIVVFGRRARVVWWERKRVEEGAPA